MTNANDENLTTRELLRDLARRQIESQRQIENTQQQLDDFISTANQVLARSAILDDVVQELRESSERHQRNFEEHQRTTNAALQSLEAILLQLIRNFP
ncbi:hypothetical protein GS682_04895 [Nostoc sp. B(2019)]|nr:hypothetical protein [Nostoc sp. B(2019)]